MAWFKREKKRIEQPTPPDERRVRTEGLWIKCDSCRAIVWKKDLETNWQVCPKCQHHFRLNSRRRLELLLDGRWLEHDAALASTDPLRFTDTKPYATRLREAQKILGMADAILTAEGHLAEFFLRLAQAGRVGLGVGEPERIGRGQRRVVLEPTAIEQQLEPPPGIQPEVMLALGTYLPVGLQVFLPDDRPAGVALDPQPLGAHAALVGGRGLLNPFFLALEPGHLSKLEKRNSNLVHLRAQIRNFKFQP